MYRFNSGVNLICNKVPVFCYSNNSNLKRKGLQIGIRLFNQRSFTAACSTPSTLKSNRDDRKFSNCSKFLTNSLLCNSSFKTTPITLSGNCSLQRSFLQSRQYSSFNSIYSKLFTVNAAEVIQEPLNVVPESAEVATEPLAPQAAESTAVASNAGHDATSNIEGSLVDYIPLPPTPLPGGIDPSTLNALGEPSLKSLGLGGWTPVGLFQNTLEFVHCHTGLPWWGSIVLITVLLRISLFPLIVSSQRTSAKLNNISPQMQAIQVKISDARQSGDQLNAARYSQELARFMQEKGVNPLKSMIAPLVQAPIFISVFIGLRKCANLPVMSMSYGGMLWFTDLTVADPYYLLPIITTLTMSATIELGTETGRMMASDNTKIMFTVMRFMPLICFPFMMNFPTAVLCYWMATNTCSLAQAGVLRIPAVRQHLNIPEMIKHNTDSLPITKNSSKKSTLQAAKDSWKNMKAAREVEDRQRFDEVRFAKAGTGPLVRTFKYDPTKPIPRKTSTATKLTTK